MIGSVAVYSGLIGVAAGLVFVVKPVARLHVTRRRQGFWIVAAGAGLIVLGVFLPAPSHTVVTARTQLDALVPVWQFNEVHTRHVDAPPERVYDAILNVRAEEIFLFN